LCQLLDAGATCARVDLTVRAACARAHSGRRHTCTQPGTLPQRSCAASESPDVQPFVSLWRAHQLTAAAAPQWGPLAFHKKSLLNLGEAMRRTRKLCAVMVDVVGREIVLNRPSKVLRRPAASRLACSRQQADCPCCLRIWHACKELLPDAALLAQIEEDGWPRFENPISVKATDKVSAAVPRHDRHAGMAVAALALCVPFPVAALSVGGDSTARLRCGGLDAAAVRLLTGRTHWSSMQPHLPPLRPAHHGFQWAGVQGCLAHLNAGPPRTLLAAAARGSRGSRARRGRAAGGR
jgi:hypothetical protein